MNTQTSTKMLQRHHSSLLEMEAADYFKLNPAQVSMFNRSGATGQTQSSGLFDKVMPSKSIAAGVQKPLTSSSASSRPIDSRSSSGAQVASSLAKNHTTNLSSHHQQYHQNQHMHLSSQSASIPVRKPTNGGIKSKDHQQSSRHEPPPALSPYSPNHYYHHRYHNHHRHHHHHESLHTQNSASYLLESTTTSTNSLPSISSSPSVSPSLVCPHISLDDILSLRNTSRSPHTIGLCAKCRLDPPPNIQSPLSPVFKPSVNIQVPPVSSSNNNSYRQHSSSHRTGPGPAVASRPIVAPIKRGYSDHNVSSYNKASKVRLRGRQQSNSRPRDDSLDYYLEPSELRRLQLSPTLRHSVEFIRKNSTEAGRILKIYKNGLPYDKPLRICVSRGEFAHLTNLLDYINSRQLIPSGARYLFHIDGQLVYSVNELKHGSSYIVSGTRNFDLRTSNVIKEQQQKDSQQSQQQELQTRRQIKISQLPPYMYHQKSPRSTPSTTTALRPIQQPAMHIDMAPKSSIVKGSSLPLLREPTLRSKSNLEEVGGPNAKKTIRDSARSSFGQQQRQRLPARPVQRRLIAPLTKQLKSPKRTTQASHSDNRFLRETQILTAEKYEEKGIDEFEYNIDGEAELISKSIDNLTTVRRDSTDGEKSARVVRAKSELSALPNKRRKNVTFVDTCPDPSLVMADSDPMMNDENQLDSGVEISQRTTDLDDRQREDPTVKALSTNEIGIQVSDSIEGFLIDLPLAIPEKNGTVGKRPYLQKGSGTQASQRVGRKDLSGNRSGLSDNKKSTRSRRQIVTISERQLSLEEMNKLRDLDHGDHHREAHKIQHVTIKLDGSIDGDLIVNDEALDEANEDSIELIEVARAGTKRKVEKGTIRSVNAAAKNLDLGLDGVDESETARWQYPGGREASTTPTERPVSQSEPNDVIRATVTTPTPSLSTAGDSASLTQGQHMPPVTAAGAQVGQSDERGTKRKAQIGGASATRSGAIKLPVKQRVAVVGKLRNGIYPPTKNFRLTWVNGFTINDQYPENSSIMLMRNSSLGGSNTSINELSETRLLSLVPSHKSQFKLSERFHNWICYSKRHDELIYPAGCLVILWCRWINEQRYYSKHTSNVSAITMASLDLDLAASAQIGDSSEKIATLVHLWSLTTLDTLQIIDDDQFRGRRIFSLKVRNTPSEGCEISVAAKNDKRLWLYVCYLRLAKSGGSGETESSGASSDRQETAGLKSVEAGNKKLASSGSSSSANKLSVIKVNKPLQSNQEPLLLTRMSNVRGQQPTAQGSAQILNPKDSSEDLLLSFGRRHFQVWLADRKQQKLLLLQPDNKSASFVDVIVRANCIVRMSPTEFLVGDSEGNITMLLLRCQNFKPPEPKKKLFRQSGEVRDLKYSVKTMRLITVTVKGGGGGGNENDGSHSPNASKSERHTPTMTTTATKCTPITCLARITGSLFVSADAHCTMRFWKLERQILPSVASADAPRIIRMGEEGLDSSKIFACRQLSSINLPLDLGFICTIILSKYERRQSLVEFYVASTSNAILFGTVKLQLQDASQVLADNKAILANSSLSVVYEGHETSALNLVADVPIKRTASHDRAQQNQEATATGSGGDSNLAPTSTDYSSDYHYFTCSVDCKICKWNGKNLVWKSMLPSACASLAVHPVGFVLATGSADGTVYILDKVSGLLISYFPLTPVCINCLAYSRDGSLLAAGCANGSIFILPVYERGLKYKKVSIFQSPYPVVSIQFSVDNQYILTSVTHGPYQELILWDLPNFRYMRDNVKMAADKIEWFDSICSGSEDVRAIWENSNLANGVGSSANSSELLPRARQMTAKRLSTISTSSFTDSTSNIVNLSCHRLICSGQQLAGEQEPSKENFVIASDTHGYLRLFRYPCYDIQQGFFEARVSSSAVSCCRFLPAPTSKSPASDAMFVSSSTDGSICLWALE